MDVDRRSMTAASPVPSAQHGQAQVKRGARGPYKKTQGPTVSDELDVEGRMPGSKDGVGAFPAGSDWAKVMLALKLRGEFCHKLGYIHTYNFYKANGIAQRRND